jgi:hypothetical protein
MSIRGANDTDAVLEGISNEKKVFPEGRSIVFKGRAGVCALLAPNSLNNLMPVIKTRITMIIRIAGIIINLFKNDNFS